VAIIEGAIPRDAVRQAVAAGAAAGNITVTGVKATDRLVSVLFADGAGVAVEDIVDLTSEFTITAADTINNTGGTSTAGGSVVVTWLSVG
jgi:adhesin HecA-like repeat protein